MSQLKFTPLLLLFACAPTLYADLVLNDGHTGQVHLMFTTSTTRGGDLGGASGADSTIETRANVGTFTSGLSLSWVALLSDSTQNANSLIGDNHPIYNTNGDRVADNFGALFASTVNNLDFDENGNQITNISRIRAWTGSDQAGNALADHCENWTVGNNTKAGNFGKSTLGTTNGHIDEFVGSSTFCNAQFALYGISSNTVAAVPEPSSFLFLGIIGSVVVGVNWFKRRTAMPS